MKRKHRAPSYENRRDRLLGPSEVNDAGARDPVETRLDDRPKPDHSERPSQEDPRILRPENAPWLRRYQIIPPDPLPDVLTVDETAKLLRVGRNSCYDALRRGELPCIRIGHRLLVPRVALQRVLAGEATVSPAADRDGKEQR